MASSKDIQHSTTRPLSQHRLSMTANPSSLPKSHSRNHSHTVSSGSLIPNHRVSRRKSVSSNASNVAAVVAAVREAGVASIDTPPSSRRATMSKGASARAAAVGSLPSPPAGPLSQRMRSTLGGKADRGESAIDDDQIDDMDEDEENELKQSRIRRASEGQHLTKDGKKSASGGDLKCDKCGKGYKHSSCLSKHLWEHTPEWSLTSKLLISKHQQVQLLEAASVLVSMNNDGTTPPDSTKDFQSDQDSASAASGSESHDRASSADTTPPPPAEIASGYRSGSYTGRHKRYSSGYSFSRSYQSAPSAAPLQGSSVPNFSGFGHHRQPSHERRPLSSGISRNHEDDGLAAAVELLSCSFGSNGTPRSIPVALPEDAPPVPNIPAQYLSQSNFSGSTLTPNQHPRQTESYTRHQMHHDDDIKMEESEESVADEEEYDRRSRGPSDEEDDGVFGRMEE